MYKIKRFGITTLEKVKQEGLLDGRVKLHHATRSSNVPSIYQQGLLGSKAHDKDNWTRKIGSVESKDDIVYLAKYRKKAEGIAKKMDEAGRGPTSVLDVSIPYNDYQGMNKVNNPLAKGTTSFEEWVKMMNKSGKADIKPEDYPRARKAYNNLIKDVVTIGGDVDSKYIKGSPSYQRNSVGEVSRYIKDNPGRFAKGVGKGLLGAVKYPFEKFRK